MQQLNIVDILEEKERRPKFCMNDHIDILIEILKRLDGQSLGIAACVCRLWCTIARNDSLWENVCFRHVHPPPPSGLHPVVAALGGYKKLYMACMRPVLSRLSLLDPGRLGRVWTRDEMQLSLSLFCVDYYERHGGRLTDASASASSSSLMFLCRPVNVG